MSCPLSWQQVGELLLHASRFCAESLSSVCPVFFSNSSSPIQLSLLLIPITQFSFFFSLPCSTPPPTPPPVSPSLQSLPTLALCLHSCFRDRVTACTHTTNCSLRESSARKRRRICHKVMASNGVLSWHVTSPISQERRNQIYLLPSLQGAPCLPPTQVDTQDGKRGAWISPIPCPKGAATRQTLHQAAWKPFMQPPA